MVGTTATRRGVWEPLPRFIYGYAVHPLSPSRRDTRLSAQTRLSTYTDASRDEHLVHRDVVSLEVGDEVYAFERYTPKDKEVEGVWYRGYVVCTSRRPQVTWFTSTEPSTSSVKTPAKVDEAQQVFIGIFPASHIFIRDELPDAEGRLAELAAAWALNPDGSSATTDLYAQWNKDRVAMDNIRDEEDNADTISLAPSVATRKSNFKLNPPPDQATSTRARLPVYPASIRSTSPTPTEAQVQKPLPPRPSLRPSDETVAGADQPIIDEISSALREWHLLMFQYLARRDYKLFEVIRAHIEALHLGRRQLLAQTLSAEETVTLRRQCVARLVTANLIQGLDVIVRHPTWGGLVTVDVEGDLDPRSWLSAVRMYAMQVSLAYMDVYTSNPTEIPNLAASIDYVPINSPQPTPAHSTFPDTSRVRTQSKSLGSLGRTQSIQPARAKFFHIFLDLRAFVASPCAPGETAELRFSLYDKNTSAFLSEDFCAVLNHNGVLDRDPTARIRTLFTDIVPQDAQHSIYLVCSIVRNGGMKMGNNIGSIQEGNRGSSEQLSVRDRSSGQGWGDLIENGRTNLPPQFRRPFGCAILELSQLRKMEADGIEISPTREHTMPIYIPTNETVFSSLHQEILNGNVREYEKSLRAEMLAVSIKIFYGDLDTIMRENTALLQDIPLTQRLGFPDVVFPGDSRNELYVKLWSGDFSASQTRSARVSVANFARGQVGSVNGNIQVSVEVRDQHGRTIDNVIARCSGEPPVSQYHSMVFQRMSQPTFGELIKVMLPSDGAQQWHLFFTFRQRNTKDRAVRNGDLQERPFAFAFLPLFPDYRAFLEDGEHKLALYRADRLSQLTPEQYLASAPCILGNQRFEQIAVPVEMQRIAPPIRDTFAVRSSLCSTRFTQNTVLLSLLNWQAIQDKDFLATILTKFTFVGEVEIVKFLRDIFDSLFAILGSTHNRDGDMDHLLFQALVTVLGIVQDRRFSNFQPVLDVYIEQHFTCTTASSHMIRSMNRLLADPTASETASALRAALKVWHYIFKFIARSRELQKEKLGMNGGATADHLEVSFQNELRAHLAEVNRMMSRSSPASIIGTQTIALQYFTSILPELQKIFPVIQLVGITTTFANAIIASKGKIIIWKLIMYLHIVKGFLFNIPQARALLVESVVMWIKPHFGRFDEYLQTQPGDTEDSRNASRVSWLESIRLSVTVIAVMLDKLQQNLVSPATLSDRTLLRQEQDNVELVLSLFPRLLDSYLEFQSSANLKAISNVQSPSTMISAAPVTFSESYPFSLLSSLPKTATPNSSGDSKVGDPKAVYNAGLGETAIVILALALSATRKHFLGFLDGIIAIEGREHLTTLLLRLFKVASSILNNDAFPDNWLNVNILAHKVLLKVMDPVASLLEREFIPAEDADFAFDQVLWREGFGVLLKLLSSEQLVIEEFSPQKRRAVWRLAGDIRGEGATLLLHLWNILGWQVDDAPENSAVTRIGNYQIALSPLVGQVVNLCLSIHDQLRNCAVQMLYCMIVSEFHVSGHFDDIENELVCTLDTLFMSDSKGDDISRAYFIGHLRHLFETSNVDPELRERLITFLNAVNSFLDLLLEVRALPEGEEFADDRVMATLRLMNFIRKIRRDEIYIKYVHQLVNMHLQSQNYVEAALTLKLHADLHEWDLHSFAPPMEDLGLPQQSQFHRKETLCLLILDYLGKGKAWESALEICKELAFQHAEVTFNYARLAEILRHQAALLEHIVTDQRYYSDYFRVAFYGNFPAAIRNKQFVYRGYEWEKFGAFCERMLNKHPRAQLLKTLGDPPVDIRFGTDQYIQCTALVPEPNRELPIFTNPEVPPQIRNYYEHSALNLFSYSRPITKYAPDGTEETWIEKTYLTTEETFPTVLRRSEVVEVTPIEISPVESALQEVQERTQELQGLYQRYTTLAQTAGMISTTPLSMTLNAAVDTPHNAGVAYFRQIFLSSDYVSRFPDRADQIEKLREAIDDKVRALDACLRLHGQLCPPEMDIFHGTLMTFFRKNFQEEIQRLDLGSSPSDSMIIRGNHSTPPSSQQSSLPGQRSAEQIGPVTRQPFALAPLDLGLSLVSPSISTRSTRENGQSPVEPAVSATKQTPLQKGLAHLARHGINGVASGPRDNVDGDMSEESPRDSFANGSAPAIAHLSGVPSVTTSTVGTSLRGRLSKFSSLNFGRRDG